MKAQGTPPEVILYDAAQPINNRYLELADIALGKGNKAKKTKQKAAWSTI